MERCGLGDPLLRAEWIYARIVRRYCTPLADLLEHTRPADRNIGRTGFAGLVDRRRGAIDCRGNALNHRMQRQSRSGSGDTRGFRRPARRAYSASGSPTLKFRRRPETAPPNLATPSPENPMPDEIDFTADRHGFRGRRSERHRFRERAPCLRHIPYLAVKNAARSVEIEITVEHFG